MGMTPKIVLCACEECSNPASVIGIYTGEAYCTECVRGLDDCGSLVEREDCEPFHSSILLFYARQRPKCRAAYHNAMLITTVIAAVSSTAA